MSARWIIALLVATGVLMACSRGEPPSGSSAECTDEFYREIDRQVETGDGQGHGPDVGSDEWKSVVEFKLGIRGATDVPPRSSEAWCRHIDGLVHGACMRSTHADGSAASGDGAAESECERRRIEGA